MSKTIPVNGDLSPEAVTAVLDVLLLSIIRAHPTEGSRTNDYKRLNAAKKALFGIDGAVGAVRHDDLPELVHMAETYIRERGDPSFGKDFGPCCATDGDGALYAPPTTLARAALRMRQAGDAGYRAHDDEEKVRTLQKKFCRNIGEWLKMANGHGELAESVFQLKLRELAGLLEPLGIGIAAPVDVLRDANSAN